MKKLSEHASAAKHIRIELKKIYPSIKFSVTSESFSMGDSVRIDWIDGPTRDEISNIVRKYQYGTFNGMTDSYEYTNKRDDLPQSQYVQTSRHFSDKAFQECWEEVKKSYKGFKDIIDLDQSYKELFEHYECWTARNFIYRILVKRDLTQSGVK